MKVWIVARHEYWQHFRRRGFLAATFVMPIVLLLVFGLVVVLLLVGSQVKTIGYVDQSSLLDIAPPTLDWETTLGSVTMQRYTDLEAGTAALQSASIDVLFLIPADYLATGKVNAYALQSVSTLAEQYFNTLLRAAVAYNLIDEANPRVIEPITQLNSVILDAPPAARHSPTLSLVVPLVFGFILLGATFAGGSYLMTSIAEEKENRIIEILASSLSPEQLMAGKIIGLGALALTQLLIWSGGAVALAIIAATQLGVIGEQGLSPAVLWIGLAVFVPTYFIIAGTLAAIGAAVSSVQEGQQLTGIVTLLSTLPLWFLPLLVRSPNGWLATIFSIIPYTAPITLVQRVLATAVPLWQVVALVVWLWIAAGLIMLLAGRIVRTGLERINGRLSLRDVWRSLRS